MTRRYLAVAEAKLRVRFPDSYSEVFRTGKPLTGFRVGELYNPGECSWMEDAGYDDEAPERTMLVIGMHLRGDARPLVMTRASADIPELDPTIYVLRNRKLEKVADSLEAAMKLK